MNYPEAAWIGRCSYTFPSRIQWLYKNLNGIPDSQLNQVPELSTTHTVIYEDVVTTGSGTTMQSIPIEQQVSLDWLVYAIRKNCWNLLLTEEKVNATASGVEAFEQRVKQVLDVAVREQIFSSYKITERNVDRKNNKVSFKFTANLLYSILGVDEVEGVVYH